MAARPVSKRQRARLKCCAYARAGVVTGPAYFGQIPVGAKIACAHFGVRLETAAGKHHSPGPDLDRAALTACPHAFDAAVVGDKPDRRGFIVYGYAFARAGLVLKLDQSRSATPGFHRETAPELEAAIDLERLTPVRRLKLHAFLVHPHHRFKASRTGPGRCGNS